jgi:hypothetical protein
MESTRQNSFQLEKTGVETDHYLTAFQACAVLCSFSMAASNVFYPFVFGVLGYVGGPFIMIFAFGMNWLCTMWTVNAALRTQANTFGDLGTKLLGPYSWLFSGFQMAALQLVLPVNIVICVQSVQVLFPDNVFIQCNGHTTALLVFIGLALQQACRNLGHMHYFSYFTLIIYAIMTVTLIYAVLGTPRPFKIVASSVVGTQFKGEPFVGMGNHGERYSWYNIFAALGIFVFSCLPNAMIVETMAAMSPSEKKKIFGVVNAHYGVISVVYLITGVTAVVGWGGDIPNPISSAMRNDWPGIVVNVGLIISTLSGFVLSATNVNRALVVYFRPDFDFAWTWPNAWTFFLASLPSSGLSASMSLFIPNLTVLISILNSLTGVTTQITAISLGLLLVKFGLGRTIRTISKSFLPGAKMGEPMQVGGVSLHNPPLGLLLSGVGWGFAFSAMTFSSALYVLTFKTSFSGASFWCDVVG